jgi:hypothetical protein
VTTPTLTIGNGAAGPASDRLAVTTPTLTITTAK